MSISDSDSSKCYKCLFSLFEMSKMHFGKKMSELFLVYYLGNI